MPYKDPEKQRQCMKAARARWAKRNPEVVRAVNSRSQKRNRAAANARAKRWRERHPDLVREETRIKQAARRAKACGVRIDPLVVLELADGICGYCGEDVDPFDFHVDHAVSLAEGGLHNYDNTRPAHPVCNGRDGAATRERLRALG